MSREINAADCDRFQPNDPLGFYCREILLLQEELNSVETKFYILAGVFGAVGFFLLIAVLIAFTQKKKRDSYVHSPPIEKIFIGPPSAPPRYLPPQRQQLPQYTENYRPPVVSQTLPRPKMHGNEMRSPTVRFG